MKTLDNLEEQRRQFPEPEFRTPEQRAQVAAIDAEIERQFTIAEAEGMFDTVTGMVVGKLVGCEEKDYEGLLPDVKELILEITKNYGFPIIGNADFGHDGTFA